MGYPDPQQNPQLNPGQHPGGQNYPAQPGAQNPVPPAGGPVEPPPGGYQPTREFGRDQAAATQGGYELGYTPGAYDPYAGQQPPQGPPPGPGGPGEPGGSDGGGSGGNKKALWIAVAAVVFVLVLAGVVVGIATSGSSSNTSATQTTGATTTTRTTTAPTTGGITMPTGIPSSITIPPIFGGGSTTGPNARQWKVEVTGTGSAQLVTIGVPDTSLFGSQPLPWSKSFTLDSPLVTITVIGYTGDVSCKITRNGTVVSEQKTDAQTGGGPLICTSGR